MTAGQGRTLLIFPPQWIPLNPFFSLCSLAGHLMGEGREVLVEDMNIRFYRHILTGEFLDYSRAKAENSLEYLRKKIMVTMARKDESPGASYESARLLELEKYLTGGRHIFDQVRAHLPGAMAVFDDREKFYEPFELVRAFVTVDKALELISLPYYTARMRFNDFFTPLFTLTIQGLTDFTFNRDENLFLPFMKKEAARLLMQKPGVIGISINTPTQLFPGLTLARLLMERKEAGCHVNVGGNYFTRLREVLLAHGEFFRLFADSVILGEGQKPLVKLIDAVHSGRSLREVPSLVYHDEETDQPLCTERETPLSLDRLHHQVLDGLPLEQYFVPDLVVSLQSSKGCYWQKCTFCDTDYGIEPDIKSLDRLIEEIQFIKARSGVRHFEFIDESITPPYMDAMARRFIREKLDISWFSNARTERAFSRRRLDLYHRSGLAMLLWGIESGSPRIMKLINKGVNFTSRIDVLKRASAAGIWNFAYIFFGLPTETREEAEMTINLIRDHTDIIHSYGRSIFTLGKHAALRDRARNLELVECVEDDQELSTSMGYKSLRGMNPREVMEMTDLCKAACHLQYGEPLWMYLRYREILFLYLSHFGMEHVMNFRFSDEQRRQIHSMYTL